MYIFYFISSRELCNFSFLKLKFFCCCFGSFFGSFLIAGEIWNLKFVGRQLIKEKLCGLWGVFFVWKLCLIFKKVVFASKLDIFWIYWVPRPTEWNSNRNKKVLIFCSSIKLLQDYKTELQETFFSSDLLRLSRNGEIQPQFRSFFGHTADGWSL